VRGHRVRLRYVLDLREETGYPDEQLLSVYREWGVVRKSDRSDNFNRAGEDLARYQFVRPGDLVMNRMKAWQGSLGVSQYRGIVSPDYYVIEVDQSLVVPGFLHHLLRSSPLVAEYAARSTGIRSNQWRLPWEAFRDISVVLPPLEEQARLAGSLDLECARLDRLAVELDEFRVHARDAFAAEVQTRLLRTPHRRTPLKYLVELNPESLSETTHPDQAFDYIDIGSVDHLRGVVKRQCVTFGNASPRARRIVRSGDVIVSTVRTYLRAVAAIDDGPHVCSTGFAVLRPVPGINPRYLRFVLTSPEFVDAVIARSTGISYPAINASELIRIAVPIPSDEQQQALADEFEAQLRNFRAVETQIAELKTALSRYRDSVFAEAVLGHLDGPSENGGSEDQLLGGRPKRVDSHMVI
jgi:type I restriction enzyme, S subunit